MREVTIQVIAPANLITNRFTAEMTLNSLTVIHVGMHARDAQVFPEDLDLLVVLPITTHDVPFSTFTLTAKIKIDKNPIKST